MTLVELLVAAMLLAIALVGLAAAQPLLMQAVAGGGFQTTAMLLAQQCLELAKSMPYARVPLDLPPTCSAGPSGFPGVTRSVRVASGDPTATTTTVTVLVTFESMQRPLRTSIATVLSQ